MENEENIITLKEQLLECIKNRKVQTLRQLFEENPIIDIAESLDEVENVADLLFVFRVVNADYTAELFTELTDDQQEELINAFGDKQLIQLLENSYADDIVDYLEDMPANLVARVLKAADPQLRADINRLLNYKENTAGSIMTTEYLLFHQDNTVEETIEEIRQRGRDAETVLTVFVRDAKRNLVGTVNLDDLIFAKKEEHLKDIMDIDFKTVSVNDDQEEVAHLFKRYDINVMAVVNSSNKICGIITVDDVVDVMAQEAAEDIAALSNVSNIEDPYLETPVIKLVLKCAPWIMALMVLQVFSSLILSNFQAEINKFAVLSIFTPLIMDASGNSGGQTTGLMIRSIGLDEFKRGDWKKVIWKEFRVASLVALIVSLFGFGWLMLEMSTGIVQCHIEDYPSITAINNDVQLHLLMSALVAMTLFVSIVLSKTFGVLLCWFATKIKKDPAVMAQPLVTTLVDVSSLLTYFLIWTLLIGPILGI